MQKKKKEFGKKNSFLGHSSFNISKQQQQRQKEVLFCFMASLKTQSQFQPPGKIL